MLLTFTDATVSVAPLLYPACVATFIATVRYSCALSPKAPEKAGVGANRSGIAMIALPD